MRKRRVRGTTCSAHFSFPGQNVIRSFTTRAETSDHNAPLVALEEIQAAARVLAPALPCARRCFPPTPSPAEIGGAGLGQARNAPARRRLQVPRRVQLSRRSSESRGARARGHRALVGQSRAGRRARGEALRRPGDGRHADHRHAAKRAGAERLGARVVLAGNDDGRSHGARARSSSQKKGCTLVPPYDDPRIIAGQGTVGLEIADDLPDVGHRARPGRRRRTQRRRRRRDQALAAERARDRRRAGGRAQAHARARSGRARAARPHRRPGRRAAGDRRSARCRSRTTRAYIDEVVTVDDAALRARDALSARPPQDRRRSRAARSRSRRCSRASRAARRQTVAVLSGGNIEWDGLQSVLAHG